eukprot:SAG11_NODE_1148_length_5683_cov_73.890561_3_plen_95_part_00
MQQRQQRGGINERLLEESGAGQLPPGAEISIQRPAALVGASSEECRSPPAAPCGPSAAGMALSLTPVLCSQSVWLILLSLNAIGPFSSGERSAI